MTRRVLYTVQRKDYGIHPDRLILVEQTWPESAIKRASQIQLPLSSGRAHDVYGRCHTVTRPTYS